MVAIHFNRLALSSTSIRLARNDKRYNDNLIIISLMFNGLATSRSSIYVEVEVEVSISSIMWRYRAGSRQPSFFFAMTISAGGVLAFCKC